MRIGLIGYGGMGKVVATELQKGNNEAALELVGVIVATEHLHKARQSTALTVPLLDDFQALMALQPDVIAECAGHAAVRAYGEAVLEAGISLVVISIGALADEVLYRRLRDAAGKNNTLMLMPAGAVGGIDALGAARLAGLNRVTYRARKPAMAWIGTAAQDKLDLNALKSAECFYRGSAREAALLYPLNSNVAATIAIAGLGFDQTGVELIADPEATENVHEIEVEANSGSFQVRLSGLPLAESPKTSALAAYSVAKCLKDLDSCVVI